MTKPPVVSIPAVPGTDRPRPQLALIEGARDQGKETGAAGEDSAPAAASEPTTQYAHAGAIARAMKANPGLTYEEALEMARDFGF